MWWPILVDLKSYSYSITATVQLQQVYSPIHPLTLPKSFLFFQFGL